MDDKNIPSKNIDEFSILRANVQNLTSLHKLQHLELLLSRHASDVCSLTETYLTNINRDLYKVKAYNVYHSTRDKYGGGVSCLVKTTIKSSEFKIPDNLLPSELVGEFLAISLDGTTCVLTTYRTPTNNASISNKRAYLDALTSIVEFLYNKHSCFCLW